jgi:hypothetical protein
MQSFLDAVDTAPLPLLKRKPIEDIEQQEPKQKHTHTTHICDGWIDMFRRVSDVLETEYNQQQESLTIRKRMDVATDNGWDIQECQGDQRLRRIRTMLESGLKIERSEDQILFHDAFIEASLPKIYGSDWNNHCIRVMEEFSIQKIRSEVMVITARRIGKTWSVAMFVLALLLNVAGIQIAIFSTGSRASGSLYDILMNMLSEIPDAFNRIVRNTREQLYIASHALPRGSSANSQAAKKICASKDTSKLNAYPDTVKGN